MLKVDKFTVNHRNSRLTIADYTGHSLEFAPGEADKLISLANTAVGMLYLPALPEKISDSPFEAYFKDDGKCTITRQGGDGSLEFTLSDYDSLVRAINMIIGNFTDSTRLKARRRAPGGINYPDPVN